MDGGPLQTPFPSQTATSPMPLPQGLQPDDIQRNEFLIGEGTQQFSKVKTG